MRGGLLSICSFVCLGGQMDVIDHDVNKKDRRTGKMKRELEP